MSAHAEKRAKYTFALANLMHIRPWEIDLLTYEQFEYACACIDKYAQAQQAGKER